MILAMFLLAFICFILLPKWISYQTVVFDPCILVLMCRWSCLWGVPGGGCWATPSSRVATQWRHLDVRQDLEMHNLWARVIYFDSWGMYWPLLVSYFWVVSNQYTFVNLNLKWTWEIFLLCFSFWNTSLDNFTYASLIFISCDLSNVICYTLP